MMQWPMEANVKNITMRCAKIDVRSAVTQTRSAQCVLRLRKQRHAVRTCPFLQRVNHSHSGYSYYVVYCILDTATYSNTVVAVCCFVFTTHTYPTPTPPGPQQQHFARPSRLAR